MSEHEPDGPEEGEDGTEPDGPVIDGDLSQLTADEVRRRTEAPLPRSLIEFLE